MSTPPVVEDGGDHAADVAAIRALIAGLERAFNANDAAKYAAPFAANGSFVPAGGTRVSGGDALLAFFRAGFAGPWRDQFARLELSDVAFPRPDVALADIDARAATADGDPLALDHTLVARSVLVRQAGRWWILARQDALVAAG